MSDEGDAIMELKELYEKDFYAWTMETAKALRQQDFSNIDIEHLIEEIESVGASERRELESHLEVLLVHLLKWQYQPSLRGKSWELTIKEQRRKVTRRLRQTPSLKSKLDEMVSDAYGDAWLCAQKETGLSEDCFPKTCPYSIDQILNDEFYPE